MRETIRYVERIKPATGGYPFVMGILFVLLGSTLLVNLIFAALTGPFSKWAFPMPEDVTDAELARMASDETNNNNFYNYYEMWDVNSPGYYRSADGGEWLNFDPSKKVSMNDVQKAQDAWQSSTLIFFYGPVMTIWIIIPLVLLYAGYRLIARSPGAKTLGVYAIIGTIIFGIAGIFLYDYFVEPAYIRELMPWRERFQLNSLFGMSRFGRISQAFVAIPNLHFSFLTSGLVTAFTFGFVIFCLMLVPADFTARQAKVNIIEVEI
ncbi:MAG: hypothetical protein NUW37_16690 [Planctomycetes bacterium]|nr:hypothetical protein [Planctomycetota bacterium]